jgi:thiol-disulfide isomerase/thioredoxin
MECDEFFKFTSPDKNLNARAHALKGEALINTVEPKEPERLQKGESELRLALEMNPELNDAHYSLGSALLKEGRDEEGIRELKTYLAAVEQSGARAEQAQWFIPNTSLSRERYAPYFSFTTLQGEHFTTNNLRGKVVLLDFWATWCPPCVASLPSLAKFNKDFSRDEFVLISISSDRNKPQLEQFMRTKGMDWQEYWDPDDLIFRNFYSKSNYGIPNFVLIDRQGIIRDQRSGWGPFYYSSLKSKIHQLLKEGAKPPVSVGR